jgi:hypothetical protein
MSQKGNCMKKYNQLPQVIEKAKKKYRATKLVHPFGDLKNPPK